ncbi:M4 family metallopeptidase [Streptomyces sp. UNOB3_S3]|uniref:M4 family metallopeptidase n=1 Tax=Streptomyces sp. UNOB3_S3 TaxID=2871682 RepID=UPI001E509E9B|nr:M4 family metallopeptidase [Streptomyces sp. UNOB3_S3]
MRKPRARTERPGASRARGGITGAAALIGAAALVVQAAPAGAAGGPPTAPGQVIPGLRTATPALVGGIREPVAATGSAADAALGHLAAKGSRYRIADPARDLAPLRTTASGTSETVRFQQKHRGVDVLGGQYVVRMEKKNGKRVVTGASGKYFTALTTGTTPEVSEEIAVERAIDATFTRLDARRSDARRSDAPDARRDDDSPPPEPLTGTARGLVVLPKGTGVLARHVTVRGTDPASGAPVLDEVYIDAMDGYPVLQYSTIKTFDVPSQDLLYGGYDPNGTPDAPEPPAPGAGVLGSGVRADGTTVELRLDRDETRKEYVMRDYSRARDGGGKPIATWDARRRNPGEVAGTWPSGLKEFGSATPAFGKEATEAGAVDAHWAAGKVHDYYKSVLGRDSVDGRGMAVNSLVGLWEYGHPLKNALWEGTKAVYGGGDAEYRPFSAALDVVGHVMTHGVVERTAGLVYAGQSGALAGAVADYFGNAIDTDAHGTPMDSPEAGLLGEGLCRTKSPRACATRDMNDGRTTSKSFLGVGFATDNGGVHLNSTIFSGALWDIRKDLDRTLADRIVYRALTDYMTPLDGFTEGRDAVVAAAKDLGVAGKDLRAVERAFTAHGIVPGWELAIGADTDRLLGRVTTTRTNVGAGGGWWAASASNETGTEANSVWAGRTDGTGEKKLISPNDGRNHVEPATDGRTVVWVAYRGNRVEVLARPIAGGPIKKLYDDRHGVHSPRIAGKDVVFEIGQRKGGNRVVYLRIGLIEPTRVYPESGKLWAMTAFPSLSSGRIAYIDAGRINGVYRQDTKVLDIGTGKVTVLPQIGTPRVLGRTAITSKHVFWLVKDVRDSDRTAVRRAGLDGTGVVDISPGQGDGALYGVGLTASEDAVTVTARTPDTALRNETLSKLWQFSADGSRKGRVSCDRGEQLGAAADTGARVVWIDATTGYPDLVTRSRPAGNCG